MSDTVISLEGIGKEYRLGTPSGTDRLSEVAMGLGRAAVRAPARGLRRLRRTSAPVAGSEPAGRGTFWALRDVSFTVQRGEVVGIIGRNGAGKSTLLKVLSRITAPTTGRFGVRGRVASLLEVGTGFHGELTGRENIFLSGTLLGMSRPEIQKRFDEITAFAEVDRFLDTPVKRYSSGMQMRLGFAVAAHLEADILIVDEVLAVGDAEFQKKCLGKMNEVARGGRTVLLVTHALTVARSFCTTGVALEGGRVRAAGPINEALAALAEAPPSEVMGNENTRVLAVRAEPVRGDVIDIGSGVRLVVEFENRVRTGQLDCTIEVTTTDGLVLFHAGTFLNDARPPAEGVYRVSAEVPPDLLNHGTYRVRLIFGQNRTVLVNGQDAACSFEVMNVPAHRGLVPLPGVLRPRIDWAVERLGGIE